MAKYYYQKTEKKSADMDIGRAGTEYYHGPSNEMYRVIKDAQEWLPLIDELFEIKDWVWYNHPWKEIRRNKRAGKGATRTPKEAVQELHEIVTAAKYPILNSRKWGLPKPAFEKVNRVMKEAFSRMDEDWAYEVMAWEWEQGTRPPKAKNNFDEIATYKETQSE